MTGEQQVSQAKFKWACVQFIAEVSLNANCKSSDLKLALALIADLAYREGTENDPESAIFYEAE